MEPELKKKEFQNQKKILIVVGILVISLFVGSSFSLLTSTAEEEDAITFTTGDLNMLVTTTGTLDLSEEIPKTSADALASSDEITLTLQNTGSLEIGKYEIKLVSTADTTLDISNISFSVKVGSENYSTPQTLSAAANIIYTGYNLLPSNTQDLKLKIWVDESAGADALNKVFAGNISAELYQKEDS